MTKIKVMLICALLALTTSAFADQTVEYKLDRSISRTSPIILSAQGSLSLMDDRFDCREGKVIKLDYELNVFIKGRQKGNIGVCVPNNFFAIDFYNKLAEAGKKSFGAFDLKHEGFSSGNHLVRAMNVDHNYDRGSRLEMAKVLWVEREIGSITSVTGLEIKFETGPNIPVLGAAKVDIKGVSNNGISFAAGFDINNVPLH